MPQIRIGLLVGSILLFLLASSAFKKKTVESTFDSTVSSENIPPTEVPLTLHQYPFEISSVDSLLQETHRIKKNQTLYSILTEKGVTPSEVRLIARAFNKVSSIRSLRPGQTYHLFIPASQRTPSHLIVEENKKEYIKVTLSDSLTALRGERPSEFRTEYIAGVIKESLYMTLVNQNLPPSLAFDIADVFAWQVDFYQIQPNDYFKLILKREYVGNEPTGEHFIQAGLFNHQGDPFYAFRYEEEERFMYLDEEASSLQKTFLKAPLRYSRVSSRYTKRRYHPVLKEYKAHLGTDYAAPTGTPVYAVADGVVKRAGYTRGNGNFVIIEHNGTYETGYLHFSRFGKGIKKGIHVKQGQIIGYVGSTGLATGPHLCYRFWKNGKQVDPYKQVNPPAQPLTGEAKERYLDFMLPLKHQVDGIINPLYPSEDIQEDMLADSQVSSSLDS